DGTVLLEPVSGAEGYPLKTAADALTIIDRVKAGESEAGAAHNIALLADFYHLAVNGDNVTQVIENHAAEFGHIQIAHIPAVALPAPVNCRSSTGSTAHANSGTPAKSHWNTNKIKTQLLTGWQTNQPFRLHHYLCTQCERTAKLWLNKTSHSSAWASWGCQWQRTWPMPASMSPVITVPLARPKN